MTFEKVKEIIMDTINCSEDKITLEANLKDDLGIDSLDSMELMMAVEDAYGITVPEEELPNVMDINDIYGIIDKFDASGCSELNLEMNGVCLGLKKTMHEAICDVPVKKDIVRINTEQEQTVTTIQDVQPQSDEHIKEIKAPLVGTFYTAAGPDEEPFVKPGQSVHAGDVIGIIEAMKLMNEVTADCDGTVKEVAAENGTMVEYGQPLVILN